MPKLKIQMRHFWWFSNNVNEVRILLHCIFIIWSVALKLIKRANEAWNQIHTTLLLWFTTWPCIPKKFQRFSVFLSEKSAPNPRDHDLDSDDDPSSNNHVLAIWHRQLLFTNPNLDRFELRLNWKWMEFNSGKTADVSGHKKLVHKTARRSRCNWSIFNHFKA